MKSKKKMDIKQELKTIVALTVAACIMAFNLKSFVQTGGLYPGGFSGLTVLIQRIAEMVGGYHIPYSAFYVPLNIIPAFIGFKFISKKFTNGSFSASRHAHKNYVIFHNEPSSLKNYRHQFWKEAHPLILLQL